MNIVWCARGASTSARHDQFLSHVSHFRCQYEQTVKLPRRSWCNIHPFMSKAFIRMLWSTSMEVIWGSTLNFLYSGWCLASHFCAIKRVYYIQSNGIYLVFYNLIEFFCLSHLNFHSDCFPRATEHPRGHCEKRVVSPWFSKPALCYWNHFIDTTVQSFSLINWVKVVARWTKNVTPLVSRGKTFAALASTRGNLSMRIIEMIVFHLL